MHGLSLVLKAGFTLYLAVVSTCQSSISLRDLFSVIFTIALAMRKRSSCIKRRSVPLGFLYRRRSLYERKKEAELDLDTRNGTEVEDAG